jgi:hypothetical protein
VKFGFLVKEGNKIATTELFKNIKLSYSEEEEVKLLTEAFYAIPLFVELIERFKGKSIPSDNLKKILIREFEVAESVASRVAGYFVDGLKSINLLDDQNKIINRENDTEKPIESTPSIDSSKQTTTFPSQSNDNRNIEHTQQDGAYNIHIVGPGVDTSMIIEEEDDLIIINAYLTKIKKKLKSSHIDEKKEGG